MKIVEKVKEKLSMDNSSKDGDSSSSCSSTSSCSSSDDERMGSASGGRNQADKVRHWKPDVAYIVTDKARYRKKIFSCAVAHTSSRTDTPLSEPSKWTEVVKPVKPTNVTTSDATA